MSSTEHNLPVKHAAQYMISQSAENSNKSGQCVDPICQCVGGSMCESEIQSNPIEFRRAQVIQMRLWRVMRLIPLRIDLINIGLIKRFCLPSSQ